MGKYGNKSFNLRAPPWGSLIGDVSSESYD